jgi:hypothetical protein
MRDVFLDVRLELDLNALSLIDDPDRWIIEAAREEADRLCEQSRAKLRTDRAPEIIVTRGENKATGQMCLLIATRWAAVVPEDTPLGAPR